MHVGHAALPGRRCRARTPGGGRRRRPGRLGPADPLGARLRPAGSHALAGERSAAADQRRPVHPGARRGRLRRAPARPRGAGPGVRHPGGPRHDSRGPGRRLRTRRAAVAGGARARALHRHRAARRGRDRRGAAPPARVVAERPARPSQGGVAGGRPAGRAARAGAPAGLLGGPVRCGRQPDSRPDDPRDPGRPDRRGGRGGRGRAAPRPARRHPVAGRPRRDHPAGAGPARRGARGARGGHRAAAGQRRVGPDPQRDRAGQHQRRAVPGARHGRPRPALRRARTAPGRHPHGRPDDRPPGGRHPARGAAAGRHDAPGPGQRTRPLRPRAGGPGHRGLVRRRAGRPAGRDRGRRADRAAGVRARRARRPGRALRRG